MIAMRHASSAVVAGTSRFSSRAALPPRIALRSHRRARGALDHADRIDLAHVRRIVGAHQDVVGAVFLDQIFELVMGVDQRIEIEPLQIGRRHPRDQLRRQSGRADAAWSMRPE